MQVDDGRKQNLLRTFNIILTASGWWMVIVLYIILYIMIMSECYVRGVARKDVAFPTASGVGLATITMMAKTCVEPRHTQNRILVFDDDEDDVFVDGGR